jgi:ElaB/YqjD/DUF883 family membrane-anchored ribosome-binding protein
MVETSDAVRRDIEMRRRRTAAVRARLDNRFNLGRKVREHPWPAIGIAFGAGLVLARTMRVQSPRAVAPRKLSMQVGIVLDDVIGHLLRALSEVAKTRIDQVRERMENAAAEARERFR